MFSREYLWPRSSGYTFDELSDGPSHILAPAGKPSVSWLVAWFLDDADIPINVSLGVSDFRTVVKWFEVDIRTLGPSSIFIPDMFFLL